MARTQYRQSPTQVAQPAPFSRPAVLSDLSFELARAVIERDPAARALPRFDSAFPLDELVRISTAQKGYVAAPEEHHAPALAAIGRSHCPDCSERMDPHGQLGFFYDAAGNIELFCHVECYDAIAARRRGRK